MELPPISQDDITDVEEMSGKLEKYINETLQGNQTSLALSALMTATINSMFLQCKTHYEILLFREIFMTSLDDAIKAIQVKK